MTACRRSTAPPAAIRGRLADVAGAVTARALTVLAALLGLLVATPPAVSGQPATDSTGDWPVAGVQDDRERTTRPGQPTRWDGAAASGANVNYSAESGKPCGATPADYCDVTVLNVDVGPDYWDTHAGGVEIRLDSYRPNPTSDFDLYVYESDDAGRRGKLVGSSAAVPGQPEATTVTEPAGYYLVQVVYYAVTESRYTGTARFVLRKPFPQDVDDPPGVDSEFLASDPGRGFRSRSEPHIAQNPRDPNMLVAGSKMYNRDPDSLDEYEFKIGTYVSFDRGETWTDLGQLAVCPPEDAPPESWPNHRCYPDEDPKRDGTGEEDTTAGPDDRRPGGDVGEEYITSDVWVQFDDEGNAYAMVLDAPPFDSGQGWGMTLHRWESVSPEDLETGETWSQRIPINTYGSFAEQQLFLDDKNTFAVNNAGDDGDGATGTMVACWGQNIAPLIKQQIVCERSTDGGRTWPDQPTPISPPTQQLVIGVHVVADPTDPDTFYATWLHYTPSILGAPSELWAARSTDGGRTWTDLSLASRLTGIPRTFPGQAFRNLSLPIMAAGPDGKLYITYAEYLPAPNPGSDADGMQADIRLVSSADGGATWTRPVTVNEDGTNADQFQPYVAVRPDGGVEVAFFDRRHDPDNFFIDQYLARSPDGGRTWTETRLSHDAWDPSVNPPISPSGAFIGDYQGLVADGCSTVAFFNDTHLANPPGRDPGHDAGLPRSPFQQVFAWRVPTGLCPAAATGGDEPSRDP